MINKFNKIKLFDLKTFKKKNKSITNKVNRILNKSLTWNLFKIHINIQKNKKNLYIKTFY